MPGASALSHATSVDLACFRLHVVRSLYMILLLNSILLSNSFLLVVQEQLLKDVGLGTQDIDAWTPQADHALLQAVLKYGATSAWRAILSDNIESIAQPLHRSLGIPEAYTATLTVPQASADSPAPTAGALQRAVVFCFVLIGFF